MGTLQSDIGPLISHKVLGQGVLAHRNCEGAKNHSPAPMILYKVSLTPWGDNLEDAWVCSNCRDALMIYQYLLGRYDGNVPRNQFLHFGITLRQLAIRGWERHNLATKT